LAFLLSIGEFARLGRVTVKTLRHYDVIGLLPPAHVAVDSGYRAYTPGQLVLLERIRALRAIGLSLDDVARALSAGSADEVRAILRAHHARLQHTLDETKAALEAASALLESPEVIMQLEANITRREPIAIIKVTSTVSLEDIGQTIHQSLNRLFAYAGEMGARPIGPPGTRYLDEDLEKTERLAVEVFVPVERRLAGRGDISGDVLPGGAFATAIHQGAFSSVGTTWTQLGRWVSERGLRTVGPAIEEYLHKDDDPAACRTEIRIPVDASTSEV
jgi:DNA-binding transcriptional MerR regulator